MAAKAPDGDIPLDKGARYQQTPRNLKMDRSEFSTVNPRQGGTHMDASQYFELKLIGDQVFIDQLKRYAEQEPDNLKVESEAKDEDPTRLGFDLATVSAVVVLVKGTLLAGELGAKLWKWMRQSQANKVVIQTPFQTLELHKEAGVTEEDVRKLLKAATELH